MIRRRLLPYSAVLLTAGMAIAQARTNAPTLEYQLKAAFIYKFATYIRWPDTAAAEVATPFVIGVIGEDPFGTALTGVVNGQRLQGRPVVVRNLQRPENALECDVVFVSASERGNLPQLVAALRTAPVLTVGDMDQFAENGGMIGLVNTEDNRVRFDINKDAIDRAGLKATSQLLRLARIVEKARSDGE